jgi:hypothetical protein
MAEGIVASRTGSIIPQLKSDLARLVAIPSISAPGYPDETHGPLLEAYEAVAELFRDAGARILDPLELPGTRRGGARLGGAAARRDQDRDRGDGGGRQRSSARSRPPSPSCSPPTRW